MEKKMTKLTFPTIERNTEHLKLIYSNICNLKYVQTRDDKQCFITFIDDNTRYYYVYLIRSKDNALKVLICVFHEFKEIFSKIETRVTVFIVKMNLPCIRCLRNVAIVLLDIIITFQYSSTINIENNKIIVLQERES